MNVKRLLLFSSAVATLVSLPAMADTFVTYPQPVSAYTSGTTNYGGGDASGSAISSLGPFSFSSAMTQVQVPPSWATWNSPPAAESSTPNVLWGVDASTLTLTLSGSNNTAGFELEPDAFAAETVGNCGDCTACGAEGSCEIGMTGNGVLSCASKTPLHTRLPPRMMASRHVPKIAECFRYCVMSVVSLIAHRCRKESNCSEGSLRGQAR